MKKLLALGILAFATFGCTKQQAAPVVCNMMFQATTAAAQGVATALSCSNVPAIAATLSEPLQKLNLCANTQAAGLVGNMVCPQVASSVVAMGLNTLPAAWGCTGGNLGTQAQALITTKCEAAVNF